jgi:hypothetical protein
MNSFLLLLCTFVMTQSAYLRPQEAGAAEPKSLNKLEDDQAQKIQEARQFYGEHYSPELRVLMNNPHLMQELYDAVQQSQQLETEYKAPAKRAQTFVRFGKRAQTFVRFGR